MLIGDGDWIERIASAIYLIIVKVKLYGLESFYSDPFFL